MPTERNSITPEGKAKAEAELRHLREVRRAEIVQSIKTAREFGDLKENAEYHAAREAQSMNEARIRLLEHHLASAVVEEGAGGNGAIAVGTRVSYRDMASEETKAVTLVHPLEASVAEGKVSVESPIGRALLGGGPGQTVELETPRGMKRLEVLEVG
ncbi:MAG TPA: transcription elongation factor GreA [Solirubrobacterales bacterium]|nr:transcription elongation factor GreA [Solirubrobacterales bacterium]